ncbi:hypothetical protein Ato02nite_065630 [Paractinoplanes toevensis]|uniref:Uncharacterized protein n=2 Tax=Paractinoplanes toevensis TaxID=571911 RepID=A0A919TFV0_9ACTN|nr:hypothetical protein Ato02nite_065630 [Actinoplanes toevensis]
MNLDRPITTPDARGRHRRRRRWLVGLTATAAAAATTAATFGAYVLSHAGNEPLPAGAHAVQVYTVDDAISTVVPATDRPGTIGRFIGMCDADSYYIEVNGTGLCAVLNGSLGTVQATGTAAGVELNATEAAKVRDLVKRADGDGPDPATRVLLGYDDGWAGLVQVADLYGTTPVTGTAVG